MKSIENSLGCYVPSEGGRVALSGYHCKLQDEVGTVTGTGTKPPAKVCHSVKATPHRGPVDKLLVDTWQCFFANPLQVVPARSGIGRDQRQVEGWQPAPRSLQAIRDSMASRNRRLTCMCCRLRFWLKLTLPALDARCLLRQRRWSRRFSTHASSLSRRRRAIRQVTLERAAGGPALAVRQ